MPDEPTKGPVTVDEKLEAFFAEPSAPAAEPAAPAPAPAAPAAAPAPAASAAPETTPQPEATAQPTAEPPASPAAPQKDPQADYIRELTQQVALRDARIQEVLEQQSKVMDQFLQAQKPQMTKEEREAAIQASFLKFNEDPETWLQERVNKALEERDRKIRDEIAQGKLAPPDRNAFVRQQINRLTTNPKGEVLRPELQKREFQDLMYSPEVGKAVYDREFFGQPAEAVFNNPEFHRALYEEARSRATQAQAPQAKKSQEDLAAQAALAAGAAAPAADGRTPGPGTPPVDQVAEEKKAILGASGGEFGRVMAAAKWT